MKTITLEQFIEIIEDLGIEDIPEKTEQMAKQQETWSALDILELEKVSAVDKLWAVLRPELIDESVLHEFACRCAEEALKFVDKPDQRSIDAIEAKRAWIRGEVTKEELSVASYAACDAAHDAARDAVWVARAVWSAIWAAQAAWSAAAWDASTAARVAAARAAAATTAARATTQAARGKQVEILIGLIEESV